MWYSTRETLEGSLYTLQIDNKTINHQRNEENLEPQHLEHFKNTSKTDYW
jgi:hypothetical protein